MLWLGEAGSKLAHSVSDQRMTRPVSDGWGAEHGEAFSAWWPRRGEATRGMIRSLPYKDWGTAVGQRGQQDKGPEVVRAVPSEEQQGAGHRQVQKEKEEEAGHPSLWVIFSEQAWATGEHILICIFKGFTLVVVPL